VDPQAYDGNTPLHLAISMGKPDLCRILIKSGANPLLENRDFSDEETVGKNAYDLCGTDDAVSQLALPVFIYTPLTKYIIQLFFLYF